MPNSPTPTPIPPGGDPSPAWSAGSKRIVWLLLLALGLLGLYVIRALLLPIILAVLIAYLVEPIVKAIVRRTRIPRLGVIAVVYLVIIAVLVSIPASAISPVINQTNNLIRSVPTTIQQIGVWLEGPHMIGDVELPIDQEVLDSLYLSLSQNILNIAQTVGGQSLTIFGNVASRTFSTVGWILVTLFLSFYIVKDHRQFFAFIMELVPESYRGDIERLGAEISISWDAFLRGQLLLCIVVATVVFFVALILGLPNALLLAFIAGLAEFLPTIGPILAAIPAVFVAYFQHDASWIGQAMSPFWFAALVTGLYAVIYQVENYYLLPRIMGRHLRLHPLVVVLGALAGARVAGLLGILLAAPILATARLLLRYVYRKLTDRPPFPGMVVVESGSGTAAPTGEAAAEETAVAPTPGSPTAN